MDRCPNCGWTDRPRAGYDRGRDFGWRGTELDRGFAGRYGYDDRDRDRDHDRDRYRDARYRDDDRYRTAGGDPYLDRGYERERDDNERFRDRDRGRGAWDDYPWNRY